MFPQSPYFRIMIHSIKKLLSKILPPTLYLKTLHRTFFLLYRLGLLKSNHKFKFHYAVQRFIQPTDVVVDIGANLGYFCRTFMRLTPQGRVVAIEPVPQFYGILKHFLGGKRNVEIHNVALGKDAGTITMVLPETDGFIRTGLPHIARNDEELKSNKTQEVKIVHPESILSKLPKINYIKCDIEGYEWVVFQELTSLLKQHRPLVQIEIDPKNVEYMLPFFVSLDYVQFGIKDFELIRETGSQAEPGDFLFVPSERENEVKSWKLKV